MTDHAFTEQDVHDWHGCSVLFPRIAKRLTRDGVRTRLIMPGYYHVRYSRTFGKWIYKRVHEEA